MQLTVLEPVRDVALLRSRDLHPPHGRCPSVDSQLPAFKATRDYRRTLEKEKI